MPLPYLPSESEKPILSTEYNNYEENTDMPNFEKILNNHLLEALVESGSGTNNNLHLHKIRKNIRLRKKSNL